MFSKINSRRSYTGASLEIGENIFFKIISGIRTKNDNLKPLFFYLITSLLPHQKRSDKYCRKEKHTAGRFQGCTLLDQLMEIQKGGTMVSLFLTIVFPQ